MKQPLLIFPFNGNGLEAVDCLGDHYELIGFIDDTPEKQGTSSFGIPVFSREALQKYPEAQLLAVPGSPSTFLRRREIIQSLSIVEKRWAKVIHPNARISSRAGIGLNTLIMAGAVITSNATLGNHAIVLPNSVIHHDSTIGDYTTVGSNVTIAGRTHIGTECYIGSNAAIINDITIGAQSLIGMGSTVIRNVPPGSKIVGNPGRVI